MPKNEAVVSATQLYAQGIISWNEMMRRSGVASDEGWDKLYADR